jgi:integrase
VTLHERGRLDLVQAFAKGKLPIQQLAEAFETGKVPKLTRKLEHEDVPLGVAVGQALTAISADVKKATQTRYKQGLDHFIAFAGPDEPVRELLTSEKVQEFKAKRIEGRAARETVNNDLGAVSVLASFCLDRGWIAARPKIKRFKTKVRIRYLEPDQVRLYMAALRPPFRPIHQLLIGSGMRLGEAESLRVCDLRIGNHENRAIIEDAKTVSGRRAAYLPGWVARSLTEHIDDLSLSGVDSLFTIPRRTVQKEHGRACEIAGIHDYTIHDHRHTAAVHLARAGMPLHLLQQQLGHTRIEMTMRYAQFHPQYSDVGTYFDKVEESFGLGEIPHFAPHPENAPD